MNKIRFAIGGLAVTMLACQALVSPATQPPIVNAPSTPPVASSGGDCRLIVASYDLPHSATDIGGKELYDLAATEPSNTYLSVVATVTESQRLVSPEDGVDGTLIYAYIGDMLDGNIYTYYVLIFLPDQGEAVSQMPVDSTISASGIYIGYFYPPKNFFIAFPNEKEDTKFPSIKAETATYGCP